MPSFTLTDVATDRWVETFRLGPEDVGATGEVSWSIVKERLHGGRRDGVDLIRVDNGALAFSVIPSRGMNLWKGRYGGIALGWKSPIADGPVNPAFVHANAWGGLGWLDGFDEWLARCGLDSYGPPYQDGGRTFGLHGRISNLPAHFVAVHVTDTPPFAITIEGHVDEARMFLTGLRLVSKITTIPGSNHLTVRDEITNLRSLPSDLQLLYHWNFGPPLMEEGARFLAPIKAILPRDPASTPGLSRFDRYGPATSGTTEEAFYCRLHGEGPEGRTLALLRNRNGDAGVALRFATSQLPTFTLWKLHGDERDGYVTGMEPATGYPNPKPFEKARHRVLALAAGETFVAETTLEVCDTANGVAALEAEIRALQALGKPMIHPKPVEPFAPES